jgi:hypothetical protein
MVRFFHPRTETAVRVNAAQLDGVPSKARPGREAT